jgi:HPt (histidine-containing phosphotransfer) domain-containing protein
MSPTMTLARSTAAAAAHARPAKPPVDLVQLRRFTLGNIELEREILELFAQQAPMMLAALDGAATVKHWRDATHTLKGSSASIGAWLVAEAAAAAELAADQPEQWRSARQAAAKAVETSLAYLAGQLSVGATKTAGRERPTHDSGAVGS